MFYFYLYILIPCLFVLGVETIITAMLNLYVKGKNYTHNDLRLFYLTLVRSIGFFIGITTMFFLLIYKDVNLDNVSFLFVFLSPLILAVLDMILFFKYKKYSLSIILHFIMGLAVCCIYFNFTMSV